MAMHCKPCLEANHKRCRIMLPAEWKDDTGRCVCKCSNRESSRLRNVERINEMNAEKAAAAAPKGVRRGPQGPSKWSETRIRELCALEAAGNTSRQIGALVGADATTVRTYLSKARKKGWR